MTVYQISSKSIENFAGGLARYIYIYPCLVHIDKKWNFSSKITFNLVYLLWLTSAICDSYWLFLPRSKINIALANQKVSALKVL